MKQAESKCWWNKRTHQRFRVKSYLYVFISSLAISDSSMSILFTRVTYLIL